MLTLYVLELHRIRVTHEYKSTQVGKVADQVFAPVAASYQGYLRKLQKCSSATNRLLALVEWLTPFPRGVSVRLIVFANDDTGLFRSPGDRVSHMGP